MDTKLIGNRIKIARSKREITLQDIAMEIGVAKSTIQRYENGLIKNPKIPVLHSIANALQVDPAWLIGKTNEMVSPVNKNIPSRRGVVINVLGEVAAGIPIEAITDIVDTEEITQEMAATGTYFGLRIKGDSMAPTLPNGSTVIVRIQDDAETGDIVIATINGDSATCKRLKKYREGISLISINPAYEPMQFTNREIEEKPVRILGKAVELRAKL